MRDNVLATIRRMLINDLFVELPEQNINAFDDLRTVVGLDSFGFAELRILCERKFNVQISDDDFTRDHFSTLDHLANLILRLQGLRSV